jgi:CRP-like cAMP-binding protein
LSQFQKLVEEKGREIALCTGQHLFRQGDRDPNVYFVKSGLLKAYYVRSDGKEHIKSFLPEGSIIGSMVALIDNDPCTFSLSAVEDGTAIALPYRNLEDAARTDVLLANSLIGFLSAYGKRKERREYELLSLSPADRLTILTKTMPDIASRVSQADLAAYIGVTPQALSRIKRRQKSSVRP